LSTELFFAGFLLLGLSFARLISVDSARITIPTCRGTTSNLQSYPPRLVIVIQSLGFILIALSYIQSARAKQFLYVLYGLLILLILFIILDPIIVSTAVGD
ncbi:MAG: hypothetical protein ACRDF4_10915, partial [Rhabdochlamydiaceae bacterium]